MDPIIQACMIILMGIGIFTLYSLSLTLLENRTQFFYNEFISQLIFTLLGTVLFIIIFTIPAVYFRFKLVLAIMFISTFILLLYVLVFTPEIKGVKRWITLGGQMTLQPSEFAKVALIIITSAVLSIPTTISEQVRAKTNKIILFIYEQKNYIITFGLCSLILGLIVLQPSLSVATIIILILLAIVFANIKNKQLTFISILCFFTALIASLNILVNIPSLYKILLFGGVFALYGFSIYSGKLNDIIIFISIASGILIGAFILPLAWNHALHDFQRDRIEAFFDARKEQRNQQAEGFQQEQAKITVGAGQFYGHGFKQISDSRLKSLPESTTDFVFAIFSFKFGFLGSSIVIFLYLVMILRIFYLADKMNDRFSSLVLVGVGAMIFVQFFANVGMNLDLLPVGGTTLPFMSAGGSSLLSMMVAIAVVQNIIATNNLEKNNYRKEDKVLINGWNV
jgi:rod shape determining protein RodA